VFDTEAVHTVAEYGAVDGIAVAEQVEGCGVEREGFHDLLQFDPYLRYVITDVQPDVWYADVVHTPAALYSREPRKNGIPRKSKPDCQKHLEIPPSPSGLGGAPFAIYRQTIGLDIDLIATLCPAHQIS
jgi:hypothetical protein